MTNMAHRGGTDYAKWASFDDEDDDPLAKLTIGNERRHPSLPKWSANSPRRPSSASKVVPRPRSAGRGRRAPTEPAAPPRAADRCATPPAPSVAPGARAPQGQVLSVELLCDPNLTLDLALL